MRKSTHTKDYGLLRRRLSEMRASAGFSQRQLAGVLAVPHSWVAKVEAGERRIDLIEFGWFCNACGVSARGQAGKLFDEIAGASPDRSPSGPGRKGGRR